MDGRRVNPTGLTQEHGRPKERIIMVPQADGHGTRPTRQQQEGSGVLSVQLPILSQGTMQGSSLRPNIPQIPQGKCTASQTQQRNMDRSPKAGHQESPKRKSTSREHPTPPPCQSTRLCRLPQESLPVTQSWPFQTDMRTTHQLSFRTS